MAHKLISKMHDSISLAEKGMQHLSTMFEQKVWIASFHNPVLTALDVSKKRGFKSSYRKKSA